MRLSFLSAGLLTFIFFMVCSTMSAQQKLADFARVVVAEDALPVTRDAAEELSHYASRIAGREIPLVMWSDGVLEQAGLSFFVGAGVADAVLGAPQGPWLMEEFMLRTVPRGVILAGDDAAGKAVSGNVAGGSRLAVYTLLDDHLGVRWFFPGELGEHVPSAADAVIPPLDQRRQPPFMIRNFSIGYTSYHTPAFRDASNRWGRRIRNAWVPPAVFGHSWFYAFDLRKPPEENPFFQEHPEWFALVNGKRQPPQICTSNPEVLDHMVQYVLGDTKRAITSISPSDGGGFCQCDEESKSEAHKRLGAPSCTALDVPGILSYDGKTVQLSDRIFTYANEIARRVREKDPAKGVGIFAYTFYNRPPVNIDRLEPNLYLSFVFQAQAHLDPIAREQWLESIAGWQKVGARMVVREGWGNHYLLDLPFIHDRQIHDSLQTAARLGFIAAYGEGGKCFATQAPNAWAAVRTMWDPTIDYEAMMEDFYTKAYGSAAEPMRRYFDTYASKLQANWPNRRFVMDTRGVAYVNLVNSWHLLFPAEVVEAAEAHLREAEQLAPEGEYAGRVALHRVGQDYTRCMLELLDCYRQLAELGVEMEFFSTAVTEPRDEPELRQRLLERALILGEQREDILLANREVPAPDEGLYAITNDRGMRQWHQKVKSLLNDTTPTRITKALLAEPEK